MFEKLTSAYKKTTSYTVDTWRVLYPLLYAFVQFGPEQPVTYFVGV